jgi:hypothetical protein
VCCSYYLSGVLQGTLPITVPFIHVTQKRLAHFGGTGLDELDTVGHGSFATRGLVKGSVLFSSGGTVPLSHPLYDQGLHVRVDDSLRAFDMTAGSVNHPLYFLNCVDPQRYHSRYPAWSRANCIWVMHGRCLALRITCDVAAGEQLLLPQYMRL